MSTYWRFPIQELYKERRWRAVLSCFYVSIRILILQSKINLDFESKSEAENDFGHPINEVLTSPFSGL